LVLVFALAAVLLSSSVRAEHNTDHRYFIAGTVTNELGEPLCGVTVRAADITKPTSDNNRTAVTDASGAYRIQLHMHDSFDIEANAPRSAHNVGDTILVTVDGTTVSATRTAEKNTRNPEGWGEKTVDLPAEGIRGTCPPPPDYAKIGIGVVGAAAAAIAIVWFVRRPSRLGRGSRAGLRELPGVGRARARELEGFGIRGVEDLAATSPESLSAGTTLTPKQARLMVKRAKESLGKRA
jgi:hypothetical protein